uniref:Uncharacterized protein n=1 Tax=Panagrolaimus sp. JU765 TaxID=591449 RepID=A0AC34RGB9_9BILA
MLIIGLFGPTSTTLPKLTWILTSMSSIFCLIYGYFIWIEIKCIHFVKLSKETGFSYSNTRPVGPPTLSLDEQRPQNQQNQNITTTTSNLPMQQLNNRPATTDGTFPQSNITSTTLPPLRHTYGTGHIGQ